MTILSVTELRDLTDVSTHKRDELLTFAIEEIENAYVKRLLGNGLFCYILENLNTSPVNAFVSEILNGGIYEDVDGVKRHFNGLIKSISSLVYADLLTKQTIVTRYGAVNKNDVHSQKPDFSSVLEQVSRYKKSATLYLEDIDTYLLNVDATDFDTDLKELLEDYETNCKGKSEGFLNEWI